MSMKAYGSHEEEIEILENLKYEITIKEEWNIEDETFEENTFVFPPL